MRTTVSVGASLASVLAASALAVGIVSPIASAQENLPIEYTAVGNDDCTFTVEFVNRTNSQFYQIDYRIDDEGPRSSVDGIPFYRWGPWPTAEEPRFPGGSGYVSDREPLTSVKTQDIRNVPGLPNPEQDTHQVDVRIAAGPQTSHRLPEWRTIEVSGCLTQTSVTLTGPTEAERGEEVAFEVAVAPDGVTGTVQFFDGDEAISEPVPVADGSATLIHAFNASGPRPITARLDADGRFADSVSDPLVVNVAEDPPVPGTGSLGSSINVGLELGSAGSLMHLSGALGGS